MKVLALDTATKTGYSLPGRTGVLDFTAELAATRDYGRITYLFHGALADLLGDVQPDLVAIETPIMRGSGSFLLIGLAQTAHAVSYAHNIPRTERKIQDIKEFATGKRKADKTAVLNALRDKGFECGTNDEADALALRLLVESEI